MTDDGHALEGSAWREFLVAATRPSPAATIGMLAVALLLLAAAAFVVAPRLVESVDPGRIMVDAGDHDVVLMHRTLRLSSAPAGPCVVALIGSSSVDCALTSEADLEARLAAALRARGDRRPVDVRLLITAGMTLWQRCSVSDRVGDRATGALVIAVEPDVSAWEMLDPALTTELERDLLDSPALAEEYRIAGFEPPATTGVYVVDHFDFLAPRVRAGLRRLLGPPVTLAALPQQTRGLEGPALERNLRKFIQFGNRRLARPLASHHGLEILGRMIERFHARSPAPVVLLESPRHPQLRAALRLGEDAWFERYRAVMAKFASAHRAASWCLDVDAGVSASDYGDALHLYAWEARERFTTLLAERLAGLMAAAAVPAR